jgi:hypothetical protein
MFITIYLPPLVYYTSRNIALAWLHKLNKGFSAMMIY